MPQGKRGVPHDEWNSPFLKQFQLLPWRIGLLGFSAEKQLNVSKLFVSDAQNSNLTKFGQDGFHSFSVNLCILHTGAMTNINGKLKHGEPVLNESFAEFGVFLDVLLGLCREVEQY